MSWRPERKPSRGDSVEALCDIGAQSREVINVANVEVIKSVNSISAARRLA